MDGNERYNGQQDTSAWQQQNGSGQMPMYRPPKKDSVGKKIGYFFLALSPAIASLILQLVLSLGYVLIVGVIEMISYMGQHPGATQAEIEMIYNSAIIRNLTGGVFAYHLLSLPIFGLWYYFGCKKPKLKQSFQNMTWKAAIIAVLGGVVMCLLSTGIVGIEQYLLPEIVENYVDMMESVDIGNDVLSTIAAVCLAPIGEELVCRGLVLYYAKKSLPRFFLANILQAAMFGLMHMNWVQGIYAFAIGLMLGYLVERYHSLIPAMLLHFVVNFSTTFWIDKAFFWVPDELYAYAIMFVVTLALTLLLVLWGGKIPKKEERA